MAVILILFPSLLLAQEEQERYTSDYIIGPRDLLDISVLNMQELSRTVRVSEDGKISLPLLGEIEAEGLTGTGLEKKLSQLLEQKYLQNPQVTVFIKAYQSKRVLVMGAVGNTGAYELLGRQTLLQLITQAGGLGEGAGDEIIVIRQYKDGNTRSLSISKDDLILRGDPDVNIPLQPDDVINVPGGLGMEVFVFGQVKNPGLIKMKRSGESTLLRAIIQAGGFGEGAKKSGVTIKRIGADGKEQIIKVNVKDIIKGKKGDVPLKDNDIIHVPESLF